MRFLQLAWLAEAAQALEQACKEFEHPGLPQAHELEINPAPPKQDRSAQGRTWLRAKKGRPYHG